MKILKLVNPRHILTFAVRGKRKFGSIHMPHVGHFADYFQIQPTWLAMFGSGCILPKFEGLRIGDKGYILDVYELETLPGDVWQYYCDDPRFEELKWTAADTDGKIVANVIHEDALFGVEIEKWTRPAQLSEVRSSSSEKLSCSL